MFIEYNKNDCQHIVENKKEKKPYKPKNKEIFKKNNKKK